VSNTFASFRKPHKDKNQPAALAIHCSPITRSPSNICDFFQDFLGGNFSCSSKELAWVYQSGREPQKIFCDGFMAGSPSSVPAGMMTTLPLFDSHGSVEPQYLQKQVAKYLVSAWSKRSTYS
jgi:hypothetical protein